MTHALDEAIVRFCRKLDEAAIRYLVGGSVAAGVWGEPRQTNDVDVEIWLTSESASRLPSVLGDEYLVSESELSQAVRSVEPFTSVQILDVGALLKFDCFLQGRSPIDAEAHDFAIIVKLGDGDVRVACAEHILVQKLRWYALGNRVSEQQWRDIEGIVRVAESLDWERIDRWSAACGVLDLARTLPRQ